MPCLSDRAFYLLKSEIERRYKDSCEDPIERIILIARLETLNARSGPPLTRAEIWEELSDIAPDFDQNVIIEAAHIGTDSPVLGASFGVGAVAMLVAAAMGVETMTANASPSGSAVVSAQGDLSGSTIRSAKRSQPISRDIAVPDRAATRATTPANQAANRTAERSPKSAFETAKSLGWQAALKAQDPPQSAQQWGETAALWRQAIDQLEQVSRQDADYAAAQVKKAIYQNNLQQIQIRQAAAQRALATAQPKSPSPERSPSFSAPQEDPITVAKRYGWQAALASQDAPHPAEKWADISRTWQLALLSLDKVDSSAPSYLEAQQVKARYQQNLAAIRARYQEEQDASQRLASLEDSLAEIEQAIAPDSYKRSQLTAIVARLQTIPAGTEAYTHAQRLIAQTSQQINALAADLALN
jgi:hypothetical protein